MHKHERIHEKFMVEKEAALSDYNKKT